ncbi:hypothetical protein E4U17_001024 [Claviceps sp. LM77 group G4]|nr:hypothetical protein E4U17_001024 [Claviceps sp. LM77 group G4]
MEWQMALGATRVAYLDRPVDFAEPATQNVSEVPLAEADFTGLRVTLLQDTPRKRVGRSKSRYKQSRSPTLVELWK